MTAKITLIQIKCLYHSIIHSEHDTLEAAIKSKNWDDFIQKHAKCGNTNLFPVDVTSRIEI